MSELLVSKLEGLKMTPEFAYEPLASDHDIRLLYISSVANGKISCRLVNTSFSQAIHWKYAALSYCWGDMPNSQRIQINNQDFFVSPNLFDALQAAHGHLTRLNTIDVPGCYLWVDAICINQRDNVEKSSQVQKMDLVYRQALSVVIWLGQEADSSAQAMSVFAWLDSRTYRQVDDQIFEYGTDQKKHFWNRDSKTKKNMQRREEAYGRAGTNYSLDPTYWKTVLRETHGMDTKNFEVFEKLIKHVKLADKAALQSVPEILQDPQVRKSLPGPEDAFWIPLLHLASRSWFSRIWTFQEVMLASEATILCGKHVMEWDAFHLMVHCLVINLALAGVIDPVLGGETLGLEGWARLIHRAHTYTKHAVGKGMETLHYVLVFDEARRFAFNVKDFCYGFLGVLGPDISRTINVDYSLPDWMVYADMVRIAVEDSSGTSFWSALTHDYAHVPKRRVANLPTWCPDFSSQHCKDSLSRPSGTTFPVDSLAELNAKFDIPASVSLDLRTLTVQCLKLDTLHDVCGVMMPERSSELVSGQYDQLTQLILSNVGAIELFFDSMKKLLEVTKIDPMRWLSQSEESAVCSNANMANIQTLLPTLRKVSSPASASFSDLIRDTGLDEQPAKQVICDIINMQDLLQNRRYFITKSGMLGHTGGEVHSGQHLCYFHVTQRHGAMGALRILSKDMDEYVEVAYVEAIRPEEILGMAKFSRQIKTVHLK